MNPVSLGQQYPRFSGLRKPPVQPLPEDVAAIEALVSDPAAASKVPDLDLRKALWSFLLTKMRETPPPVIPVSPVQKSLTELLRVDLGLGTFHTVGSGPGTVLKMAGLENMDLQDELDLVESNHARLIRIAGEKQRAIVRGCKVSDLPGVEWAIDYLGNHIQRLKIMCNPLTPGEAGALWENFKMRWPGILEEIQGKPQA